MTFHAPKFQWLIFLARANVHLWVIIITNSYSALSDWLWLLGHYVPLILAPAEGCWVGLWSNNPRKIPWSFHVDIFIRSVSGKGSWSETRRVGSSLRSFMIFLLPKGRHSENFVLISLLEVWREWGFKKGGTCRTVRVPDRWHGGQGHFWCHE